MILLTPLQFVVVHTTLIMAGPGQSDIKEQLLRRRFKLSGPAISQLVKRMETEGLICSVGRRQKRYNVLSLGKLRFDKTRRFYGELPL